MSITAKLIESVNEKDYNGIRNVLWAALVIDPLQCGNFKDNYDYLLAHGINKQDIFQPDDNRDLNLEATKENYELVMGQLRTNFSELRLNKQKQMAIELGYGENNNTSSDIETNDEDEIYSEINQDSSEDGIFSIPHDNSQKKPRNSTHCREENKGFCEKTVWTITTVVVLIVLIIVLIIKLH